MTAVTLLWSPRHSREIIDPFRQIDCTTLSLDNIDKLCSASGHKWLIRFHCRGCERAIPRFPSAKMFHGILLRDQREGSRIVTSPIPHLKVLSTFAQQRPQQNGDSLGPLGSPVGPMRGAIANAFRILTSLGPGEIAVKRGNDESGNGDLPDRTISPYLSCRARMYSCRFPPTTLSAMCIMETLHQVGPG